ncbi:hypothetical protein ACFVH7_11720 [Kitasatospora indigofera]|uniref:hypothetical protein n=1 Tax=Kitasatospora indigofera TaxID=67307 RepID=UPI003634E99C
MPTPGAAYAQTGAAGLEVAIPYTAAPGDGTQPSKVCVHLANVTASALGQSGKAVQFSGVAGSRPSLTGTKEIDIPAMWPANCPFRIPPDTSKPAVAIGFLNAQITTENQGRPTRDKSRAPTYEPERHRRIHQRRASGHLRRRDDRGDHRPRYGPRAQ